MVFFMKKNNGHNLTGQVSLGLTAAGATGATCLCLCAVLNQGIFVVLIFTALFTMASIGKKSVYTPSSLLAVIFVFLLQFNSLLGSAVSLALGSLICFALNNMTKSKKLPDFITGGCYIGLALCTTILFTNTYFGIGASGFTPLEMLKSYRSLGFHPDFRGLLYGTITLFTMITYPFKFRKLKNVIPAEFITIAIPFVLNLILNPDPAYTTTNEYSGIELYSGFLNISDISDIAGLLSASISTGFILYVLSQNSTGNSIYKFFTVNPAIPCNSVNFSGVPPVVAIIVSFTLIALFPSLIYRLPLPCAGAMLIVSAWQHTCFKPLSVTFKEKSIIKLLLLILCATSFVVLPVFFAVVLCVILWLFTEFFDRRREATH